MHGQRDHQLGLGTGFEAVIVVLAGREDLFDDFAELIDLDREDTAVGALVALLLDGAHEDVVELDHPMSQQVLEADDHRCLQAHPQRLVDHVHDANAATGGERLHLDETIVVDREMAGTPALESIMILRLRGRPGG